MKALPGSYARFGCPNGIVKIMLLALSMPIAAVTPPKASAQETVNYASVSGRVTDPRARSCPARR